MAPRTRATFLALILFQAAHSVEEYTMSLYEVFAPARFVSGLVSDDLANGFLVVNAGIVAFGIWCYAVPIRSDWPSARGLVWFWAILELGNGIGHVAIATFQRDYFPGVATAPFLIVAAIALGLNLWRAPRGSVSPDERAPEAESSPRP